MKERGNKSANKEHTITAGKLESIELQDTVEEKRLQLALDLRRQTCS